MMQMKILACKHLEAQMDWFAKRGFSCLGALIIFGSSSESTSNEIMYQFFISDDTTQDTDAVNTIKHFLYKEVLPKYGMRKVHYRCDGAAALNCAKSKTAMPRWFDLTNGELTEVSFKVSVSGAGKTSLDGQFGIMTQHLKRLVNHGKSYSTAEELYDLLVEYPLRYSEFHLFQPKRHSMIDWSTSKAIDELGVKMFYLLEYDQERKCTKGFYHSRHSKGIHLKAIDNQCSQQKKEVEGDIKLNNDSCENDGGPPERSDLKELLSQIENNNLKLVELKAQCHQFQLRVSGTKPVLCARLKEKINKIMQMDGQGGFMSMCQRSDSESQSLSTGSSAHESSSNESSIGSANTEGDSGEFSSAGSEDELIFKSGNDTVDEYDRNTSIFKSEGPSDNKERNDQSEGEDDAGKAKDPNDPWIHIDKSTWSGSNAKVGEKGVHSKIDYMTRQLQHNQDFMGKKNSKFDKMNDDEIDLLRDAGLHVCAFVNEDTKERCTRKFKHCKALEKHWKCCEEGNAKHSFPRCDLLSDILVDATKGKWALALACGSMPNRCRILSKNIVVEDGQDTEILCESVPDDWYNNGCYRRDIRKRKVFRASMELVNDLQLLYLAGERRDGGGEKKNASKYTPAQAVARLANMKDEDGQRKYSYRKGNKNGPLPTEAYVQSWFSRQKNNKGEKGASDVYDSMDANMLKKMCIDGLFGGTPDPRPRDYIIKMLMLDDLGRDESDVCDYSGMSIQELNNIRKAKELPTAGTKKGFKFMLRMRDKVNAANQHAERVQNQLENVLAISDALENMNNT